MCIYIDVTSNRREGRAPEDPWPARRQAAGNLLPGPGGGGIHICTCTCMYR